MKLLLQYLVAQRNRMLVAMAFAAANQVFLMVDPYVFRRIVDDFLGKYQRLPARELVLGVGFWVSIMLGSVLIAWVSKSLLLDNVNRAAHHVSAAMFGDGIRHSLELPYLEFERRKSGDSLERLQRLRWIVERFIVTLVNTLFSSAVRVVAVIGYSFCVYWPLGLLLAAMTPVLGMASVGLSRRIKDVDAWLVEQKAALAGSATETLRNIEVVKSLGLARQEIARLEGRADRILHLELERTRRVRRLTFFHGAAVHFCRALLILSTILLMFRGHVTVGQAVALYLYASFFFVPLQEFSLVVTEYRQMEASMHSFSELLATPQEHRPDDWVELGPLVTLEFEGVRFQYPAAYRPALCDVSFRVARGQTVAFVGPSGAGKTTLIKLISGLYAPDSGRVLYNGVRHSQVDMNRIRHRIGLVTQDTQLFAGSLRDNLLFANPNATDEECIRALEQAALDGLLSAGSDGLGTLIGEGGLRLSGGEKQRLAIARAMLRRPDVLIFDEATSSLDSITEKEISDTMRDSARAADTITILIAHRLSTALHADCIYILDGGAIVQSGTHAELVAAEGLYRDLWSRQATAAKTS